jgi:hypothetical protein
MTIRAKQLGFSPRLILARVQPQLVDRAIDGVPPGDQLGCRYIETDALRGDYASAGGAVDWILGQHVGQVGCRERTTTAAVIGWN